VISDDRLDAALEHALSLGEVGVQVAAYLGEEILVDTWVGSVERDGAEVDGDTLFAVFSVTKGIVATAAHLQAERGLLDYNERVTAYWPEYGRHGKEVTTVADVLSHRAGVPQMPVGVSPETMCDWEWMIGSIEDLVPRFAPGTTNAYHELVWGWIVAELVQRTDPQRRRFPIFLDEELCQPLGISELYLGAPDSVLGRIAPVIADWEPDLSLNPLFGESMPLAVFPGPPVHNLREVRQGVHPGAGVITNARSGARLFALLANGGTMFGRKMLSPERVASFSTPRPDAGEVDRVMGWVAWIGVGGYWLGGQSPPAYPVIGPNPHTLAHPGIGGSIAWADPDLRLAVCICHNWMQPDEVQGSNDPAVNPFLDIAEAVRAMAATAQR
jgi:CubicO group peptidase (beta-lactamase class C family)